MELRGSRDVTISAPLLTVSRVALELPLRPACFFTRCCCAGKFCCCACLFVWLLSVDLRKPKPVFKVTLCVDTEHDSSCSSQAAQEFSPVTEKQHGAVLRRRRLRWPPHRLASGRQHLPSSPQFRREQHQHPAKHQTLGRGACC